MSIGYIVYKGYIVYYRVYRTYCVRNVYGVLEYILLAFCENMLVVSGSSAVMDTSREKVKF